VVIEKRLKKEGLDPDRVAQYIKRVGMRTIKVTKKGEEEEDKGGTFIVSYLFVLILYVTLIFYGQAIMRGVIEEKNSRVVEIIVSSLRPFQLMMGKILGIAAVGFTQYAIWALFGFSASRYSKSIVSSLFPAAAGFKMTSIPPYIFVYFVVFFILGYFLFATIYAAIGSMVNSEKEAQQLVFPVIMFLVIPMMLMALILRSPNSSLSVILSLIPFFAPILMLMRITILLPPFIEIASSIALLALSVLLMIWLTAKIYRVGILMYGKRPSIREVAKWMKYG
jgi:ABC-2 type transport system permease protein